MKRGKPSAGEQSKLYKDTLEHFEKGHSAVFTARELSVNRNTVDKYFAEFREKMIESMDKDFINRQKTAKEFALAGLDSDLEKLNEQYDDVDAKCKDDPENSAWESIKTQIISRMADIRQQKADLEMSPTLDVSLEQLVEERMDESSAETKGTGQRD